MLEKAKWIGAPVDFGTVCPVFRRTFDVIKPLRGATLTITAIGCYAAHINGSRVGNFVLAPGWTSYDKRIQVQTYDVTALLSGKNTLDIEVGEGWHLGRIGWNHGRRYSASQPAAICALELTYQDDTAETIVSDERFEAARTARLFSGLYDGELYDARQTDYAWEPVKLVEHTKRTLIPQEGEQITEQERRKPETVSRTRAGDYVLDFGQNLTGYVEFTVRAPRGSLIELYHGEILDAKGDVYTANLRTAKQRIQYIADGERRTYKPLFTFQGFRYARVVNWSGELEPEAFTAIVVSSDLRRTGFFSCSNEKVNKLYENIIWSQRDNFLDVPTDCPQRDERLGWTGDAQIFVKTAAYNYDVRRFFDKWLSDLAADQFEDGGVPAVIPDVLGRENSSSSAWGDAAVICPWQLYLTYGDTNILRRQYDSMCKWVQYIKNQGDSPCLWNTGHHFGDWLGLDAPYGSYKGSTDPDLIATAYFAYSTSLVIKAGRVLGYDSSEYEELYAHIRKAYQDRFIKDGRLTSDTQTAHALTLCFDLADDAAGIGKRLNSLVGSNGNKLKTGFVGTPYLLHALSKAGFHETAYTLLLQEDFPSWLYSVNLGATTIWEHWDGMNEKGELWSTSMNSFNHYAYGAVGDWMYEVMAGIKIDETRPAFQNTIFQPVPDPRIAYASASVDTPNGPVSSRWERKNGEILFTFRVPKGCTATVVLEGRTHSVGEGEHTFTSEEPAR